MAHGVNLCKRRILPTGGLSLRAAMPRASRLSVGVRRGGQQVAEPAEERGPAVPELGNQIEVRDDAGRLGWPINFLVTSLEQAEPAIGSFCERARSAHQCFFPNIPRTSKGP